MISWFERHNKTSWFITLSAAVIIFYVSSLTFGPGIPSLNILSILYHILAFFGFAFFLQISLVKGKNKKLILAAIFIAALYAISDEFHQIFVPGRYFSISDVFLDTLGTTYSVMLYLIIIKYREFKKKSL